MKMFGTVFFALCMFFLAYIILASAPLDRIDRGCLPFRWAGKAMTTVAALGSQQAEARMRASTEEMRQSCRFFLFRQFYADELARQEALLNTHPATPAAPADKPAHAGHTK